MHKYADLWHNSPVDSQTSSPTEYLLSLNPDALDATRRELAEATLEILNTLR